MKKVLITIALVLLSTTLVFASPLRFVFGDLGQHTEILGGFLPSYFMGGVGVELPSIVDGSKTELQFLVGAGYNQRKLWQDPTDGTQINDNPLIYDVIQTDWSIRFAQGFLDSPVAGKDLITLTAKYDGKFELAKDSMVVGKERVNNSKNEVAKLDSWLESKDSDIYPELCGNRMHIGTIFGLQAKVDLMDDQKTSTDGFVAKVDALYAPNLFNRLLNGHSDFYQFSLNTVGAQTLYRLTENGFDLFTIVFIDRINIGYLNGKAVPAYASGPFSLGRKVRGFNTWTYNTEFAVVNNLDLRFAGPSFKGIFPRINLFIDCGYGAGDYTNSSISSGKGNFLSSTGIQATVSFFDFIDLGYQVAYLITGDNFVNHGSKIVGSFTFFLDF